MARSNYNDVLLSNLRETSDGLDYAQCYRLCAKKENVDSLYRHMHQVIWGRRGTGKTTLLKSFLYYVNNIKKDNEHALYIMMSDLVPTSEEINKIEKPQVDLPIYIFKKLLSKIADDLLAYSETLPFKLSRRDNDAFENVYLKLDESITIGRESIVSIARIAQTEESNTKNSSRQVGLSFAKSLFDVITLKFAFAKNKSHHKNVKTNKEISFSIETTDIRNKFCQLVKLLKISHLYLCLDEFSDIDKGMAGKGSIQSQIAQLIKQVFLKSTMFSVKIASIWNNSKLSEKNTQHGIEYKQDIFDGPDLDIMFLDNNDEALSFFKEILLNTYLLDYNEDYYQNYWRSNLSSDIINTVFGENEFRHLVCGSQGIARSFSVLAREFIKKAIKHNKRPGFDAIFRLIIDQYLDNVKNRIAYELEVPKSINKFIDEHDTRYFLISKPDYDRCEEIIKFLASKNFFMQFPGHRTPRVLRDKYKLFLINYGNYLDSRSSNLKVLAQDSKLLNNGILFPEINPDILADPEKYVVKLPSNCESQHYCTHCGRIVYMNGKDSCPICNITITPYSIML